MGRPRGATYVRNGSVADLVIEPGCVRAIVGGSEAYSIKITIQTLKPAVWKAIGRDCAESIDSLFDLLQGRFNEGVMERLTQADGGLFPHKNEISMSCSCPDSAGVCKHIAATFYGIAVRLDQQPELLFKLRNVDHLELIGHATSAANLDRALSVSTESTLSDSDLGSLFGIELESAPLSVPASKRQGPKKTQRPDSVSAKSAVAKTVASADAAINAKASRSQAPKLPASRSATAKLPKSNTDALKAPTADLQSLPEAHSSPSAEKSGAKNRKPRNGVAVMPPVQSLPSAAVQPESISVAGFPKTGRQPARTTRLTRTQADLPQQPQAPQLPQQPQAPQLPQQPQAPQLSAAKATARRAAGTSARESSRVGSLGNQHSSPPAKASRKSKLVSAPAAAPQSPQPVVTAARGRPRKRKVG